MNTLKEEFETFNRKLDELSDEELKEVSGGIINKLCLDASKRACSVCTNRMCKYSPKYRGNN